MPKTVVKLQRGRFLDKNPHLNVHHLYPPYVKKDIAADLVRKGWSYQTSFEYVDGTSHMEAYSRSQRNISCISTVLFKKHPVLLQVDVNL